MKAIMVDEALFIREFFSGKNMKELLFILFCLQILINCLKK